MFKYHSQHVFFSLWAATIEPLARWMPPAGMFTLFLHVRSLSERGAVWHAHSLASGTNARQAWSIEERTHDGRRPEIHGCCMMVPIRGSHQQDFLWEKNTYCVGLNFRNKEIGNGYCVWMETVILLGNAPAAVSCSIMLHFFNFFHPWLRV